MGGAGHLGGWGWICRWVGLDVYVGRVGCVGGRGGMCMWAGWNVSSGM